MRDAPANAELEALVRRAGAAAFPGFRLRRLARTASTQDVVHAAAAAGAAEGFCCVTAEQTAGRGRDGRAWVAPPGTALLCSLLLRRRLTVAAGVPLAAGLAVSDSVLLLSDVACRLKWPNDILAPGGKLGGVLAESTVRGTLVLGFGVNLTVPEFPPGVPGVSLHRLAGKPVSWGVLLAAILPRLVARLRELELGGVAGLRADWTARAAGLGSVVRATVGPRTVEGIAVGIDDEGALRLRTAEGELRVVAGDVHLLGEPPAVPPTARSPQPPADKLGR